MDAFLCNFDVRIFPCMYSARVRPRQCAQSSVDKLLLPGKIFASLSWQLSMLDYVHWREQCVCVVTLTSITLDIYVHQSCVKMLLFFVSRAIAIHAIHVALSNQRRDGLLHVQVLSVGGLFAERVHVRLWPLSSQLVHAFFVTNHWSKWTQYKAYGISKLGTGVWAKAWTSIQW